MRFNEKELVSLSRQPSEKAAELGMRGPKKGDGNKKRIYTNRRRLLFYCSSACNSIVDAVVVRRWKFHFTSGFWLAVVKKRLVKLVVNFLFYFRTDEEEVGAANILECLHEELFQMIVWHCQSWTYFPQPWQPIGALLLEQCRVEKEDGPTFSIGELHQPQTLVVVLSRILICHHNGEDIYSSNFPWTAQ